jgi:acyl-CoA synthetase (AMP-forming)/AMP-acid ligase II
MASLHPDDVINMQYTSGTTGFPKGVMLSNTNLIGNAMSMAACMKLSTADAMCIPVPFFHCFGCVIGNLCCMVSGTTMAPVVAFSPAAVLKTIEALRCTTLLGVPKMFIAEFEEMDKKFLRCFDAAHRGHGWLNLPGRGDETGDQGHDHPWRGKHLPARDRRVSLHLSENQGCIGGLRRQRQVRR